MPGKRRLGAAGTGAFVGGDVERTTFDDESEGKHGSTRSIAQRTVSPSTRRFTGQNSFTSERKATDVPGSDEAFDAGVLPGRSRRREDVARLTCERPSGLPWTALAGRACRVISATARWRRLQRRSCHLCGSGCSWGRQWLEALAPPGCCTQLLEVTRPLSLADRHHDEDRGVTDRADRRREEDGSHSHR